MEEITKAKVAYELRQEITEERKTIEGLKAPFVDKIRALEEQMREKIDSNLKRIDMMEQDFSELLEEVVADDEFKASAVWKGNNLTGLSGDFEVVAKYKKDRKINVSRVNDYCQEKNRMVDFISIIDIKIGACETEFGKNLTKAFSDYEDPELKSVDLVLSESALRKKLSKATETGPKKYQMRTFDKIEG